MSTVQSQSELIHTLTANAAGIYGFGMERLDVLGSFARDTATPQSDVDVFVEFAP